MVGVPRQRHRTDDTTVDFPQLCTHELFEQQVARDPGAVALVFGQQLVTYGELNERANRVAHYLRGRGVGPDVLVGVCLERSPALVTALLGVWKAGGAYVPLDPTYPTERVTFMIRDTQISVLLTEEKCRPLVASHGDKAVYLDSEWPMFEQQASTNLDPVALPSHLAYVMYTSGSTGKPKGAMIVHRGLVNYLWWAIRAYAVEPGCLVPIHTSISFDLTVTSLYPALLAGGTVELVPEGVGVQNLLAALLRADNCGVVKITPAHLELLSRQISPEQAAGMAKVIVIGGENLLAENLRIWRDFAPETRIINEYGPTETVVGCCVYTVASADPQGGSVPIGRPIANTQLHVLDSDRQPVAPGVMGEIFIGGAGVARGYLNRPELTDERFVPDPFSNAPAAKMYKTGDLGRWRSDGTLEYLGRADDQVKVRGYRIELGEIEATLAAHPAVQSCTVLARQDEPGNTQLVGYVVTGGVPMPSAADLGAFLKETLPDYMIPARFMALDALPLTPNGKIDRKALPPPPRGASPTEKGGTPITATEKAMAAIWNDLLKLDGIGVRDDFFDLGGDSLTAVALLVRIKDAFGVDLELASLFDRSTISALSEAVDLLALTDYRGVSAVGADRREEFEL